MSVWRTTRTVVANIKRRRAATTIARILKPGGVLIVVDSLQLDDKQGWDGLVAFPHRFHEPYYAHYADDDLVSMFTRSGLELL